MNTSRILKIVIILGMLLASACSAAQQPAPTPTLAPTATPLPSTATTAPLKPTTVPTPAPSPTATGFPAALEQIVEVGGHKLPLFCKGEGEPTIILENELDLVSWDNYDLERFSQFSRTCRYLRAGMNDEALREAVTTEEQVRDLHDLLVKAGVPGPYILVGHSIGGLNLMLFSYHYPDEIAGLVCVDCYPLGYEQKWLELLGPEQVGEAEDIKNKRKELTQPWDYSQNREYLDLPASEAQASLVTDLGDVPFVILVAEDSVHTALKGGEAWLDSQKELSQLSSRGRMEILPGASHMNIHDLDPVTYAVGEVVNAARPSSFFNTDQKPKGRIAFDTESNLAVYVSNTNFIRNTWTYDHRTNTWNGAQDKPFDFTEDVVYDSQADRVIAYDENGRIWAFDANLDAWTDLQAANTPIGRHNARMAFDSESDNIILFGGIDLASTGSQGFDETWAYDYETNTWTLMNPSTKPPATNSQGMAYDAESDRVILWGGEHNVMKNVWAYDYNRDTWEKIPYSSAPGEGLSPSITYDPDTDRVYVYLSSDFYSYDYNTQTWEKAKGKLSPLIRVDASMVYMPELKRLALFGGSLGGDDDIWMYDPLTGEWTQVYP